MSVLLPLLLIVLMVGIFAGLLREGLWSNAILFINVLIAALLATNFFEPLADWLSEQVPRGTYFWDIVSLWVLFSVALLIARSATDRVSRVKVRFKGPVDQGGGYLFGILTAWIFVCFVTMTLHTAPLARNFFFEGFRPENRMMFGAKPDRVWLAFVHRLSKGPMKRRSFELDPDRYTFDHDATFMPRYASRRQHYAGLKDLFPRD